MMRRLFFISLCVIALCGCKGEGTTLSGNTIEYADFIEISGDTILSVNNWEGVSPVFDKYLLVPRDSINLLAESDFNIPVPIKNCAVMSTTYLPFLKLLGCDDIVTALSGTLFVYDSTFAERINEGLICEIGAETSPDYERVVALNPDLLLAYGVSGSDNSYIEKFRKLGIKVLVINDYLENNPLGKLEYIKLFGALTNERERADSIFNARASEYEDVAEQIDNYLTSSDTPRCSVLINIPFKDIWYVPGEDNYITQIVRDAGGEILGARPSSTISSQEGFERMYSLAMGADVWIHLNSFKTLQSVAGENSLYKNLPVFEKGELYNNVKRCTAGGGSDFWEGGAADPVEILKDMATLFHPELFPDRELKYYIKLE